MNENSITGYIQKTFRTRPIHEIAEEMEKHPEKVRQIKFKAVDIPAYKYVCPVILDFFYSARML